jgi:hypothetical protein
VSSRNSLFAKFSNLLRMFSMTSRDLPTDESDFLMGALLPAFAPAVSTLPMTPFGSRNVPQHTARNTSEHESHKAVRIKNALQPLCFIDFNEK